MSTKIERRRSVVTLHHGNYEAELDDLREQYEAAARAEITGGRRAGSKSAAAALAVQHDKLRAEADETATKVTVWAIGWDEWTDLTDFHPPREDNADDAKRGYNPVTFPGALLRASLVDPSNKDATSIHDKVAMGGITLRELDLSRLHYVKLETAAWNVNVGDDELGKVSLVSLHKQVNELGSKPPPDSE